MPLTNEQGGEEKNNTECEYHSIELIERSLVVKMNKHFDERVKQLKDNLVTLIAEKLSVLIEKNHTLTSTLENEVKDLQQEQNAINQRLDKISCQRESAKKEITVMHGLVKTFNSKLTEIEENSQQSIKEVEEDVQSIRENICEMLEEVPQVTMSSLETRFNNIEARLETSGETIESKNSFNSVNTGLIDVYSQCNHSSKSSFTKTSIESHEELMSEVANEVDERQKRRKALVIHNIEENDNDAEDEAQVSNILNRVIEDENLVQQQWMKIYRLGRRIPNRNRTVKVLFQSEDFCKNVLQNARKISDSNQYKHIVFQPDLTPMQRQHLKLLVEEKKQRNCYAAQHNEQPDWIIRRGKLCRRSDIQ